MELAATQAIPLSDYEDEEDTDGEIQKKQPVAELKVLKHHGHPETVFSLYEGCNMIGRDPSCNIHIDVKALSKKHAFIEIKSGHHFLVDKGSKNKTRRNKMFLVAEARYEIKTGDKLTFADIDCVYKVKECKPTAEINTVIPESGSETGSELGSSFIEKKGNLATAVTKKKVTIEESDPSSDFLQPTQHFPITTGKSPKKTDEGMGNVNTLFYATDSDGSDNEALVEPFQHTKTLVAETPAPTRPKKMKEETFIPDSQADADTTVASEGPTETILYEDDEHTETDIEERRKLAMQPTQAFGDVVAESDDEIAETQAFDHQAKVNTTILQGKETKNDNDKSNKSGTVAYEMDIESTQRAEEIKSKKSDTVASDDKGETHLYNMEVESTQTGSEEKKLNNSDISTNSDEAPTQTYPEDTWKKAKEVKKIDLGVGDTMAFDYEEYSSDDEPIIPLVKTPLKFKESKQAAEVNEDSDSEIATQAFDMGETVAIGDHKVGTKNEADGNRKIDSSDETQEICNDETLVVEGDNDADETETQVVGGDHDADETVDIAETSVNNKRKDKDETVPLVDDTLAATQVFTSPVRKGGKVINDKKDETVPLVDDTVAATQVFTSPVRKSGKVVKGDEVATQCADYTQIVSDAVKVNDVYDKETCDLNCTVSQEIEVSLNKNKRKNKGKHQTSKPIVDEQSIETQVLGKDDRDKIVQDMEQTQVIEINKSCEKIKTKGDKVEKNVETFDHSETLVFQTENDETQVFNDKTLPFKGADETLVLEIEGESEQISSTDKSGTQPFSISKGSIENSLTYNKQEEQSVKITTELSVFKSPTVPGKQREDTICDNEATQLFHLNEGETQCISVNQKTELVVSKAAKQHRRSKASGMVLSPERMLDFDPGHCSTQLFETGKASRPDIDENEPTQMLLSAADISTQKFDEHREVDSDGFVKPLLVPVKNAMQNASKSPTESTKVKKYNTDDICTQAYEVDTDEEDTEYESGKNKQENTNIEESNKVDFMAPTLQVFTDNLDTQAYGIEKSEDQIEKDQDSPIFACHSNRVGNIEEKKVLPEDTDMLATQAYELLEDKDTEESKESLQKPRFVSDDIETQAYEAAEDEEQMSKLEMELSIAESNKSVVESNKPKKKKSIPKSPRNSTLSAVEKVDSSQPESDMEVMTELPEISVRSENTSVPVPKKTRGRPRKRKNSGNVEENVSNNKKTKTQHQNNTESELVAESEDTVVDYDESNKVTKERVAAKSVIGRRGRKPLKKKLGTKDLLQGKEVSISTTEQRARSSSTQRGGRRGKGKSDRDEIDNIQEKRAKEEPMNDDQSSEHLQKDTGSKKNPKATRKNILKDDAEKELQQKPRTSRGRKSNVLSPERSGTESQQMERSDNPNITNVVDDSDMLPEEILNTECNNSAVENEQSRKKRIKGRTKPMTNRKEQNIKQTKGQKSKESEKTDNETGIIRKISESSNSCDKDTFVTVASERIISDEGNLQACAKTTRRTRYSSVGSNNSDTRENKLISEEIASQTSTRRRSLMDKVPNKDFSDVKGKGRGRKSKSKVSAEAPISLVSSDHNVMNESELSSQENNPKGRKRSSSKRSVSPQVNLASNSQQMTENFNNKKEVAQVSKIEDTSSKIKTNRKSSRRSVKGQVDETQSSQEKDNTLDVSKKATRKTLKDTKKSNVEHSAVIGEPSISGNRTEKGRKCANLKPPASPNENAEALKDGENSEEVLNYPKKDTVKTKSSKNKKSTNKIEQSKEIPDLSDNKVNPSMSKKNQKNVTFEKEEEQTSDTEEPSLPSGKDKRKKTQAKGKKSKGKEKETDGEPERLQKSEKGEISDNIMNRWEEKEVLPQKEGLTKTGTIKGKRGPKTKPESTLVPKKGEVDEPPKDVTSKSVDSKTQSRAKGKALKRGKMSAATVDDETSNQEFAEPEVKKRKQLQQSPSTPKRKSVGKAKTSTPETSRRRTLDRKPRVMFTGVVDEEGQKVVKNLGGDLVDNIEECTHLVTDKVRRTVKFLCGVARGLLIVTPEWLEQCRDSRMFIDAMPFLVHDSEAEKCHGFKLKKTLEEASQHGGLLQGYKIHVTKNVKPEPNQMKDIIYSAEGEFVSSVPKKVEDTSKFIVVSCQADANNCKSAIKQGIPVVGAEFILSGILKREINIKKYKCF